MGQPAAKKASVVGVDTHRLFLRPLASVPTPTPMPFAGALDALSSTAFIDG